MHGPEWSRVKLTLRGMVDGRRAAERWAKGGGAEGRSGSEWRRRRIGWSCAVTYTHEQQTKIGEPQLAFLSRSGLGCGGCRALRESFPHRASLPFPQPPPFPRSAQWSQWRRVRRTSLRSLGSGLGHGPTLDFRRSGRSAWCSSRGSPNVSISAVLVVYSRSVAVGYSHISGTHIVTRHVRAE